MGEGNAANFSFFATIAKYWGANMQFFLAFPPPVAHHNLIFYQPPWVACNACGGLIAHYYSHGFS